MNLAPEELFNLRPGRRGRDRDPVRMRRNPPEHCIGGAECLAGRVARLHCRAPVSGDRLEYFRLDAPVIVSEGETAELHRVAHLLWPDQGGSPIRSAAGLALFEPFNSSC